MSVEIVKGSLIPTKEDVIAHQVNCKGVMGAGLAKYIREQYPLVFEEYKKVCQLKSNSTHKLLGLLQLVKVEDEKIVANIFSQNNYGRDKNVVYTDYKAMSSAFNTLKNKMEQGNLKTLGIPYGIGCGLANGDWEVVYGLIKNIFDQSDIQVKIYYNY